jgi:colicin import membrane protein
MESLTSGFIKSFILHIALGGFLFATANFEMPSPTVMQVQLNPQVEEPEEKVVSAVSVDQTLVEKKIAELKQQEDNKKTCRRKTDPRS